MTGPGTGAPGGSSLRGRLAFLAKDSVIYGLSAAFNKSFALITFPLLARHFSVAEYGLIDFVNVMVALLATALIFGQDSAIARFLHRLESDDDRREMAAEGAFTQVGLAVVLSAAAFLAADPIARALRYDGLDSTTVRLAIAIVPCQVLINYSQTLLKWTFRRNAFIALSLGSVVANLVLLLLAVLWLDCGVNGAIAVTLCCKAATAAAGLWLNRAWVRFPSRMRYAGELALYAAPFGIACLLGAAMPAVERAAIGGLLGADQIGLYAGAAKVAAMVALFVGAFETAWGPFHLAIHREDGAQRTFNVVLDLLTTALCATCLLLAAASPWLLPLLASSKFAGASVAVFPLAMALVARAIGWVLAIGIGISMKSRWSLVGELVGAMVSFAGIVSLTPGFGIAGTAFGVLGGELAKTVTCYWAAQSAHPMRWRLRRPLFTYAVATAGGGIATALSTTSSAAAGSAAFVCTALCVLAVSLSGRVQSEWKITKRLVLRRDD